MKGNNTMFSALVGLAALFAPLTSRAGDPPSEPIEIALAIDSLELGPEVGPRVEERLYNPMSEMLESQAFKVLGPGDSPMTVLTSLAYLDESNSNYTVHIDLIDEQGTTTPLIDGFACMACTERRLIEQTLEGFQLATKKLPHAVSDDEPDCAPAPQLIPAPVKKIGPLGYTGGAVGSVGLLMVIAGSGLLAGESAPNPSADAVLGIGITALSLGVAAILGDVLSRRSSNRPHKLRIEPAPPQSGIAFSFGL